MTLPRAVALALALSLALAPGVAHAVPQNEEAKRLLDKGNELFGTGDYEQAGKHYEAGYMLEPDPVFLYAMGQAKLKQGDCAAAVKLYKQFLATDPSEQAADAARDAIVFCADSLTGDEPATPEPVAEPEPEPAPVPDEPRRKRKDRPAWATDALGWSLVGVGLGASAAGVGLLAAAQAQSGKDAATYGDFDAQVDRVRTLRIGGGVVLGVGAALIVGGIVRLAIVSKRGGAKKTDVAVWVDRGAGFVLTRRF